MSQHRNYSVVLFRGGVADEVAEEGITEYEARAYARRFNMTGSHLRAVVMPTTAHQAAEQSR